MNPVESVPVVLFTVIAERFGLDREVYCMEGTSGESEVVTIDPAKAVSCAISLAKFTQGGRDTSLFRLWSRKPGRDPDAMAPKPIFTIRGGPRPTGAWSAVGGEQLQMDVILDYGFYSSISLAEEWGQQVVRFMFVIVEAAVRLSKGVERERLWSEDGMQGLRGG